MTWALAMLLSLTSCDDGRAAGRGPDATARDVGPPDAGLDAWAPPYVPPDSGPPPDAGSPPVVTCRSLDAGSSDAGESLDAGADGGSPPFDSTCSPPPSECVGETDWVVYWVSDGCGDDGTCRFTASYVHCPSGCYSGGCIGGFT